MVSAAVSAAISAAVLSAFRSVVCAAVSAVVRTKVRAASYAAVDLDINNGDTFVVAVVVFFSFMFLLRIVIFDALVFCCSCP